jgi:hypothetical protein
MAYLTKAKRAAGLKTTRATWSAMKDRCTNPRNKMFRYYGGNSPRVLVCDAWLTFEGFLSDMRLKPAGTILSRHLDSGPYAPGNVSWHTRAQSALEQRRTRLKARYGDNYGSGNKN